MSWMNWAEELRKNPELAVTNLLRGSADISPFERSEPYEFLLSILPPVDRNISASPLGVRTSKINNNYETTDLGNYLDQGLVGWLTKERQRTNILPKKLSAYSAQICEALQWPVIFKLPESVAVLKKDRAIWIKWLNTATVSAFRDPEYDYWQLLASHQVDDSLQFFWQSFVIEAGRTRSTRYKNLGLLAIAQLPLSDEDSLRNLRVQVQALIDRYKLRKSWGTLSLEDMARSLSSVIARNPTMSIDQYRVFLKAMLSSIGEDKCISILSLLGLNGESKKNNSYSSQHKNYRLIPPSQFGQISDIVAEVKRSSNITQAWKIIRPIISIHEEYVHKSGDAYHFVRTLDQCVRSLCKKYAIRDPEIQTRILQWIYLALRLESEDTGIWMLWQLYLRQTNQPRRSQYVLWEMTRRFPSHIPSRVELARLLAIDDSSECQTQAYRLLHQVLELDPEHLHAYSTLSQLAIENEQWDDAIDYAKKGLSIDESNEPCAVLLASAHIRRSRIDGIGFAIEHLQRFVKKHKGNRHAEDYLNELMQKKGSNFIGKFKKRKSDHNEEKTGEKNESDLTWIEFSKSIGAWITASTNANYDPHVIDEPLSAERVLPLPQALRRELEKGNLTTDLLGEYDIQTVEEFPLETRLLHYLATIKDKSTTQIGRSKVKDELEKWLSIERQNSKGDSSWVSYLDYQINMLGMSNDVALAAGESWLKDLLDRYQPLPAPILS